MLEGREKERSVGMQMIGSSPSPSRHNPQKKALFTHWAGEGGSKEGAICEERRILVTAQLPHPLCSTTLLFQSSPRALGNRNVCVREERIKKGYLWTSQGCCIKQDVACVRALGTGLCCTSQLLIMRQEEGRLR